MRNILTEVVQFGENFWYNALPVGKFYDSRYGAVVITPALVQKLAENFGHTAAYPLPVKLGHGDGAPSPGTIKAVKAESDGLHIQFDLDEKAAQDVKEGRFRYMSAEYVQDYQNKETGKKVGPALLGVALVNQPAHPGVRPIAFSDGAWSQTEGGPNVDEQVKELELKLAEMEKERERLARENEEVKKLADDSATEAAKLREEKRVATVTAFCDGHIARGVPPVVLEKIKPILLADSGTIKLSDGTDTDVMKVFSEVLEVMPKVTLGAVGQQAKPEDRAIELADDIATRANARAKK